VARGRGDVIDIHAEEYSGDQPTPASILRLVCAAVKKDVSNFRPRR
jgi:hypothetical protein